MKVVRSLVVGVLFLMGMGAMSTPASATWLGLDDGTYDVTLTCVFSTIIPCPSTISGTVTIAGAGATAFDFVVDGQTFTGAPTNGTATTAFGTDEFSRLDLVPFSTLALEHFLNGGLPGFSQDVWVYCNNATPVSCTPDTIGNWTATAVPEPAPLVLVLLGVGVVAVRHRMDAKRMART